MAEIGLFLNIASLLKLSNAVLTNCWDYVVKVKNASKNINKLINEVSGLESLLKQLSTLASAPENDPRLTSLKALYALPTGPFQACTETLTNAAKKLEKIARDNGVKTRFLWPFEGDKLQELLDRLEKHKATFMLALAGDSLKIQMETNQRIQGIETQLDDCKIRDERKWISEWLSGADPSMNHNLARKRCESGTGEWLFDIKEFKEWRYGRGRILWLHGIPGTGKTVLSSTLIEQLKADSKRQPVRIAFYYFDFSDRQKQTTESCVRSLVKQLFDQSTGVSEELKLVFENVSLGRPTVEALAKVLREMLNDTYQDFIVIDALDECTEQEGEREREAFFDVLREVKCICDGAYNIFIASRPEPDIQRDLSSLGAIEMTMERSLVDHDIRTHIGALLLREPRFKKWPETIRTEIQSVLLGQSKGMFRWAACQLEELRRCLKPSNALKQLQNLPKTLEATYARILERVPEEYEREMQTILTCLTFAVRPMTIQEVSEATAVDLEKQSFSTSDRFPDPYDILDLCSSLVSLSEVGPESAVNMEMRFYYGCKDDRKILQFAHFSVKEYIVADLRKKSASHTFCLNTTLSHKHLAEMCLIYLLDLNGGRRVNNISFPKFPFQIYAALHWTTHLTLVAEKDRVQISKLLLRLFDSDRPESLINYLNIYNPTARQYFPEDSPCANVYTASRSKHDFETPLYYACYYGLLPVVNAILGKQFNSYTLTLEELARSLEAAASAGHDEIVKPLLSMGADPNGKCGTRFFRPIQAAAHSGQVSTIKLLLEAGADVSQASYGDKHGTALHVAAKKGNVECIETLLEAGHEINCLSHAREYLGSALRVAAEAGNDEAVACLVRCGADPRLGVYSWDCPLSAACETCTLASVKILIDAGANLNGTTSREPLLHTSAERGSIPIMELLLQLGADIEAPGGVYGSPMKAAIQSRDPDVFKFMIERGADINGKGSTLKYPVDQAIWGGNLSAAEDLLGLGAKFGGNAVSDALEHSQKEYLVKLLLARGADPNAEHEKYGNMLQYAIIRNCEEETIRGLLEAGADVNLVEGEYGTALQATASRDGSEGIVRLLFAYGANPNPPPAGTWGSPLQAAVACKQDPVVQLLLENGTSLAQGGVCGMYGSVLQAAAFVGNETLVTYLLNHDVEVNLVGGEFGTAIRAAIAMDHESIVEGLLLTGVDANIDAPATHTLRNRGHYREFKSTVEVAVASCNTKILQVLLNHGMMLDPQYLEDALEHLVSAGIEPENQLKMIDFLVSKGVDVRTHGGKAVVSACAWRRDNLDVVRELISLGAPFETTVDEESWADSGLIHAVDSGRRDVIEILLNAGADVNFGRCKNGSVLDRAIDKGDSDLAMYLLDKGADPNSKAGQWGTPVMKAISKGDDEMFHELLRRGAEINITHGYWGTPLQTAIHFDYYHLAHELLDRGADTNAAGLHATALTAASGYGKAGQVDLFKRLLISTCDLDAFDVERPEDYFFFATGNRWYSNALQRAARAGNETTAELLLDNGANVNALGGTYGTALQFAAKEGREKMVKLLLERGADVNLAGGDLCTALQAAASEGTLTLVQLLLEKGADVNIEGGKYGSALQAACSISSTRIVKELLARGANINTYCGMYGSPLQAAASRGAVEIVKTLIESGADVQLGGGQHGCALQAAACSNQFRQNHLDVMEILLENGANVNTEGGEFGTALQAAAYHHRLYVELLLKHGADPRIKGGKYGSAIGAAKEKGMSRLVKLLEERTHDDI